MIEHVEERRIEATPEEVFDVVADFGGIAEWARFIQHSSLLTEQTTGVGASRRVQMARQTVVETVTVWDEPSELTYTIDGLPPIVGAVRNRWTLVPSGQNTTVTLTTRIEPGRMPHQRLIAKRVAERLAFASGLMLAGLAERIDAREGSGA
jgi:ribosome-associated toxin RatA of RatAB toxin-antitoxin module